MTQIFYIIMGILFSGHAIAGGGGCEGLCTPNPTPTVMVICKVADLKKIEDFDVGQHQSFAKARLIMSQFAIGNNFIFSGVDHKIKYLHPELTDNFLHLKLEFELYSSLSPNKQFYYLLNWGSYPDDYPLLNKSFVDFSELDSYGYMDFSISFEYADDISGAKNRLIRTHLGKMKCESSK